MLRCWDELEVMTVSVIPEAAEVTIGKNGNKHKLKDCWITNETKALVEKRDKQGAARHPSNSQRREIQRR